MSSLQPYILSTLAVLGCYYMFRRSISNDAPSGLQSRQTSQERGQDGEFLCAVSDIHAARSILMSCKLPLEVADLILDHAEYWAVERSITQREVSVSTRPSLTDYGVDPAACLYLQTDPIAESPQFADLEFLKCRKVVFRITAKDQGWVTDQSTMGTYHGAHSWFDASILRPETSRTPKLSPIVTLMAGPFGTEHRNQNLTNFANFYVTTVPEREVSSLSRGGWKFVMNGEKTVWALQRNKVAHPDYLSHTVVWREDNAERDEGWLGSGAGNGSGFVSSLARGDRIIIWARAMFPGWENNVSEVVAEVYYSL